LQEIGQRFRWLAVNTYVYSYYYAASRKVAGSRPDEVDFFFSNLLNPSGRAMALGSTQLLTEMSTRNLKNEI
jgi:hypothetical protein